MADETATVETVKVYDIGKQEYVEKPVADVEITNPDGILANRELPEEDQDPDTSGEGTTPPPDSGGTTTPPAETKPAATTTAPPAFEPGTYIKDKWGKYGIQSEEDVEKTISAQKTLIDQHNSLKAELDKVKAEPKYRTEQEKKIAEFLAPYDPSKFGDGLNTVAEIIAMDVDNIADRKALEEAYILKHPDLTREESKELFSEEYDTRFKLDRDSFDSDEQYNQRKRITDIKMKNEVAQARKELKEKKESLKYTEPPKTEQTQQQTKAPEAPAEAVQAYTKDVETFFNPSKDKFFDRLNYLSDDGKEVLYSMVLDKEKLDSVKEFMTNYVKSPSSYAQDGKIPNFAPQELAKTALRLLYGDWMEEQLWKQVKVVAGKLKAEQIAGQSPEKRSGGTGDAKLSISDQFKQLAQKEKEKRNR